MSWQLKADHKEHQWKAQQSHEYYTEVTTRCKEAWATINELEQKEELSDEERETLSGLKNRFTYCHNLCRLPNGKIGYWGLSAQPGSRYYLQKVNHDVFGMVNHCSGESMVYLFDEHAGLKNTDHTISYLTDYISKLPGWIQCVHLFVDNTCSTNKNYYLMSWPLKWCIKGSYSFFRISFLLAGHTKFSPDLLFTKIAVIQSKWCFHTNELKDIISDYAEVIVDDGTLVCDWREILSEKYSKIPGIWQLHDFIFVKHPTTLCVVARVQELCYTGSFREFTSHVLSRKDDYMPFWSRYAELCLLKEN